GSFANQVLAQMHLYARRFAELGPDERDGMIDVTVLPRHLDEEVARYMVEGFGGVITQLTEAQSEYVGVPVEGPYKPDHYRY
ncbi:MAG TPA: adenosylhomocysteinase, partial [Cobetia sp.]|nr:adenosylhomocysteinase [Cobetia sp.]